MDRQLSLHAEPITANTSHSHLQETVNNGKGWAMANNTHIPCWNHVWDDKSALNVAVYLFVKVGFGLSIN